MTFEIWCIILKTKLVYIFRRQKQTIGPNMTEVTRISVLQALCIRVNQK